METERPNWHTDESWEIESLDWENSSRDFSKLRNYVRSRLELELGTERNYILDLFKDQEFDNAIRRGAFLYSDKYKKIGMAIHIMLWMREQIRQKLNP